MSKIFEKQREIHEVHLWSRAVEESQTMIPAADIFIPCNPGSQ